MFERFTDRARRVLVYAQEEARKLRHNFIGTEHILLGLLAEGGIAGQALDQAGVTLEAARDETVAIIGAPISDKAIGEQPFTPRAKKTLELALREALQLGHDYIGTEHILLGLLRLNDGSGREVLMSQGVSLSGLRGRTLALIAVKTGQPMPQTSPAEADYLALSELAYFLALAAGGSMASAHGLVRFLTGPKGLQARHALANLIEQLPGHPIPAAGLPVDTGRQPEEPTPPAA